MIGKRLAAAAAVGASTLYGTVTAPSAQTPARTWSNVMYLGGAAGVRGKSLDWDNRLTIGGDKITFTGKNKIRFEIETRSVRGLNYKGFRHDHRDAATFGYLAGGLAGIAAAYALRSTDHYLELEYTLPDGTAAALMFRLHKDNQQDIIDAVHAATGIEK